MRPVFRVDDHVGRFDVAMQYALLVGVVDGECDTGHDLRGQARRQGARASQLVEIAPGQQVDQLAADERAQGLERGLAESRSLSILHKLRPRDL